MQAYWNDGGHEGAQKVSLDEARLIWSDEVRGVRGNFFGLTDDGNRTVQLYFEAGIPDDVEDARHLRIVLMDFPKPEQRGSYSRRITIGEVDAMIEKAFLVGIDSRLFGDLAFNAW